MTARLQSIHTCIASAEPVAQVARVCVLVLVLEVISHILTVRILGLATTFINENDVGVLKDLRSLLTDSKQLVPEFIKEILYR